MKERNIVFKLHTKNTNIEMEGNLNDLQISDIINNVLAPSINASYLLKSVSSIHAHQIAMNDLHERATGYAKHDTELTAELINLVEEEEVKNTAFPNIEVKDLPLNVTPINQMSKEAIENAVEALKGTFNEKFEIKSEGDIPEQERDPAFYKTGIKYDSVNGDPRYRLHYACPKCNKEGRHYIPSAVESVTCHDCQSRLEVRPSTSKGFGHGDKFRDGFGNFFVAYDLLIDSFSNYDKATD